MKKLMWIVVLAAVLLPVGTAQACPMCKDSIPNSDAMAAGSLPGGFNVSVYYMLFGLFTTIGLTTGVITRGVRSSNRRMMQQYKEMTRKDMQQ